MGNLTEKPPLVISSPVPASQKSESRTEIPFNINEPSVLERKTLRKGEAKTVSESGQGHAYILYWDPYVSNGYINIPYSKVYDMLGGQASNNVERVYKYRGVDAFLMNDTDFYNFEKNDIAVYLPISAGRYLILEKFEIPYNVIAAQKVAQDAKYVNVFTDNFPRFLMSLKAVIFGSISYKTRKFFDILMKHLSNNVPGRLILYDVLDNVRLAQADIYTYLLFNKTTFYRLLPLNVTYSRSSNENNFLNIEISGIVLEQVDGNVEFKQTN
jgi:hypothetical protein